jgi:hypothetical protein
VTVPLSNPIALDLHEVKEARAHRINLDGVRDHLVPHLAEKLTTKEMWDALKGLYGENKLWVFVSTIVTIPLSNPTALDLHEVNEARAQRIILDGVRDHLTPHLDEKLTTKEMWDALKGLYKNKNTGP